MSKKHPFLPLVIFLFFCTLFTVATPLTAVGQEQNATTTAATQQLVKVNDITVSTTPNSTTITIVAENDISDYSVNKLAGTAELPPRMYIDIENVDATALPRTTEVGTSVATIRTSPRGNGVRIVFSSASSELFAYTAQPVAGGIQVTIDDSQKSNMVAEDTTLDALITSSEEIASTPSGNSAMTDTGLTPSRVTTAFSGYDREKISVDFYKIDLHNVFRLLREISGQNIIVDDSVSGSLTLALSDVPWDFALDVILNLKDLAKEERFNTTVIYPKSKPFVWPEQAVGSLTIEEAPLIIAQEELIIERASQQPKEVLLAKEVLKKARQAEKQGQIEHSIELYTQAHGLWPQNSLIPTRIATLYLVNLGINAKATYYAKEALKADPNNIKAALYAAIGSANMGRTADAAEYFRQSISGNPPLREALVSFAAFSENNGNNKAALTLLKKLHSNYGETVDTMVSMARVYDKMGSYSKANEQYSAILASGYQIRPSLRDYINERIQLDL